MTLQKQSIQSAIWITIVSLFFTCGNFIHANKVCDYVKREKVNLINKELLKISKEDLNTLKCNLLTKLTPLHQALLDNHGPDIVNALLEKGINTTNSDIWGKHALHFAAKNLESVLPVEAFMKQYKLMMIDDGNSVKAIDNDGKTALHYAAEYGNTNFIKELINYHYFYLIDVNAVDRENKTALYYAVVFEHKDTIETLLGGGAQHNVGSPICPLLENCGVCKNSTLSFKCEHSQSLEKVSDFFFIAGILTLFLHLVTFVSEITTKMLVKLSFKEEKKPSDDENIDKTKDKDSTSKISNVEKKERVNARGAKTPKASLTKTRSSKQRPKKSN